jgi:hypothetical protein
VNSALYILARGEGLQIVLQAGSMHWPCIGENDDDGQVHTHFGYQWTGPNPNVPLPEIHIWAGDVRKQEVIDLSVGTLPEACKLTTGREWTGPKPPAYLWTRTSRLPKGVHYELDREATLFAMDTVQREWSRVLR